MRRKRLLRLVCRPMVWFVTAAAFAAVTTGVVVNDFAVKTVFGRTTSGGHRIHQDYMCKGMVCAADLDPTDVTEVPGTAGNFFDRVSAQYPTSDGWSYASAVNPLSAGSLKVHTYNVTGSCPKVGAEIHVEYAPGAGDPNTNIHWVQVVTDNHNITNNPGHGNAENTVDDAPTSPYYEDNGGTANPTDFYDFSARGDGDKSHTWQAVNFLVQGPAIGAPHGLITFLGPGFRWGWRNDCQPPQTTHRYYCRPSSQVIVSAFSPIAPGSEVPLTVTLPAKMLLSKLSTSATVNLMSSNLMISIDPLLDFRTGTDYRITQGSGQFQPYLFGSDPIGVSHFTILDGGGWIQWMTGEISAHADILVTTPGFPDIRAVADGTGLIDVPNNRIVLDPDSFALELPGTPGLSATAILTASLALAALSVGLVLRRQRRMEGALTA